MMLVADLSWTHSGPAILAAFLASFVEFVEALTIVLAVGTVRGWRPALAGAGSGALLLVGLVIAFGPLLSGIPLKALQAVVGILLLLFGMRWLRKAILRAAGVIPLHDEAEAFAIEKARLEPPVSFAQAALLDPLAVATTFKAVVLEGVEVVFIVIAIGSAGNRLVPASIGAAAAGLLVIALGLAVHKPLAKVPENTLKLTVGVMLSAFGVFWVGEGAGFHWPGEDLAVIALAAALLLASLVAVLMARAQASSSSLRKVSA